MTLRQIGNGVKRPYRSPRRAAQAKATRAAILDAARRLFVESGYAGTTIRAIAERSEVAEQTVYGAFGDKASIALALIRRSLDGSEGERHIDRLADRLRDEPDLARRTRIAVRWSLEAEGDISDLRETLAVGAGSDPRLASLIRQLTAASYEETRQVVDLVVGPERARDIDRRRLTDVVWTTASGFVYGRLVRDSGWSVDEYESWLSALILRHVDGIIALPERADGGSTAP